MDTILKLVGFVVLIAGALCLYSGSSTELGDKADYIIIGIGVQAILTALVLIGFGQVLTLLEKISNNTSKKTLGETAKD